MAMTDTAPSPMADAPAPGAEAPNFNGKRQWGVALRALGKLLADKEDTGQVFEIMRALHRVLTDQPLRDRMKERGYQQAMRFSWETSVRRILETYREVAAVKAPDTQNSAAD